MIIVRENQSMLDLALISGGTIECMFELAEENDISVTGRALPGRQINTDTVTTINRDVLDLYTRNNISPATIKSPEIFTGIGYMIIGKDFKVG